MREKELRLALVCYGGVSLAVYMHGVTKEIWRLMRASRNFHDGGKPMDGSQGVYHRMFDSIAEHSDTRLRVFADIISGSSAGGINGVFLAQAIATGQSLEPLTDMWLDKADVDELMETSSPILSRWAKGMGAPLALAALKKRGSVKKSVSADGEAEISNKLSRLVRARWFQPPFGGRKFSELMIEALEAMAMTGDGEPLLPHGQPLDLFATATDFYGHPQKLVLHSPKEVYEREHRIVMAYATEDPRYPVLGAIPELAFAARATASFPGAFPAFGIGELDEVLRERRMTWSGREKFLNRILPPGYEDHPEKAWLIDGAVLNNAPFAEALGALRNRPARREVDRRFVYIDPVPGAPDLDFTWQSKVKIGERAFPGFFTTIVGAATNIPRSQPIRDSLDALRGRSQRIERFQQIGLDLRTEIDATIERMFGSTFFLTKPTPRRLANWRRNAAERAIKEAGYSYLAYGHLRLDNVIEAIVATAKRLRPPGEQDTNDLRDALRDWMRENDRMSFDGGGAAAVKREATQFLRTHDVRYRIRRMRYMARRLSEDIEPNPDVSDSASEALRDAIYEAISRYTERETSIWLGDAIRDAAKDAVDNPGAFSLVLAEKQALEELDAEVDALLCRALLKLPDETRKSMLLTWLGFPLFDIATLPLLEGEMLDEFDPIKVDRISPDDCGTIREGGADAMLRGQELNWFGAFFSRAYRENDYLWGRLNAAERVVDIVFSSFDEGKRPPDEVARRIKRDAFRAIVDEERERLTHVGNLFETLDREINAIPGE